MRQTLAGVLLLATAALADLPVHCLHGDIAGDWTLHISKPIGASFPNCSAPYETAATIRVRLNKGGAARVLGASENAATVLAAGAVTPGAGGSWTTIYDEGWEVRVGGHVYFAFSRYEEASPAKQRRSAAQHALLPSAELGGIDPNVVSLCNETLHGEWHDDAFANWGCYRGVRDAPFNAPCSGPSCRTWGTAGADAADVALMVGIHSTGSGAASASGGAAAASGNPGLMSSADAAAALEAKVNSAQRLWRASSSQMPAAKRDRILEMLRRAPREAPASAKAAAAQAAATAPGSAGAPAAAAAVALLRAADRAAAEGAAASAPRNGSADRALLASLGVPASLDWRTHKGGGWLSPVRSQSDGGTCGSCYALATLAMVEARTRIASGGKQSEILSPLDVVGCSPYSQGCNGGFPYLVGKYGIDFGYVSQFGAILAQFCTILRNSAQFF